MKSWMLCLFWEGIPFLLLFFILGSLALLNWDYENKLISLDNGASDWTGAYMGPILLGSALGLATLASLLLFMARLSHPKPGMSWALGIRLGFIAVFLIFPSLSVVVLGPAAITMMEQMRNLPK